MTSGNTYEDSLNWLYDLQYFGMKLGLENTTALLADMGNPHMKFRSVHVAGTNGKGSVCAFLTAMLSDSGLKIGTYTSPHLSEFGERICVGGFPMTRREVVKSAERVRPKVEALGRRGIQCTFFEVTTCMAFQHFAQKRVDFAVVEVGMGGRLDATNVITPELSVITNISREHTQHLGDTLAEIASEKAGIIKRGIPAVSAVPEEEPARVIAAKARETGSKLFSVHSDVRWQICEAGLMGSVVSVRTKKQDYGPLRIRLAGEHQALNLATSVLAAEKLAGTGIPLSADDIRRGAECARWPARLQTVRLKPRAILDATHNPGGAETLARFLGSNFGEPGPVIVLAMLADKEVGPVVESLEPLASKAIVSQSSYHRRMKAEELASRFEGRPAVEPDIPSAIRRAMRVAGNTGTVLVTGSIFTASEALSFFDAVRVEETVALLTEAHGAGAYPGRDPADATGSGSRLQDPFAVLISTILSQRTRDENTHAASEALLSRYGTPEKLAAAKQEDVERLIRSTGFYRQKARNVIEVSRILRDRHSSAVPADLAELLLLPGVGRKTANCVLSYGFGIPAIAVDTHVHRICNLMGLVNSKTPEDTEDQLSVKVERGMWNAINRLLVRHGQTVCLPVKPNCGACPISHLCDTGIYLDWQSS